MNQHQHLKRVALVTLIHQLEGTHLKRMTLMNLIHQLEGRDKTHFLQVIKMIISIKKDHK